MTLKAGTDNSDAARLAVFCDYDGTFAVQDVGACIAERYAGSALRRALKERLRRGELTPWTYNMALFDGLQLPERELDAFLQSIELTPGARELLEWCEQRAVRFRILSDGFDHNLERLQQVHGLRFAFAANRLWYEADTWRLAPGSPDASCSCGTGVCKARLIRNFRAHNADATVVHIGNGRVSDLCASQIADRVFAKDTLAEELEKQQVSFTPFEDLHDVLPELEALWRDRGADRGALRTPPTR